VVTVGEKASLPSSAQSPLSEDEDACPGKTPLLSATCTFFQLKTI
jgi:hypothetical protein